MSIITKKLTVGLVSIAVVFSVISVQQVSAQSQDVKAMEARIAEMVKQLEALQAGSSRVSSATGSTCPSGGWTRNLAIGSTGEDVRQLQRFLNSNPNTQVATSGAGSPGRETTYYGPATARAVSRFQKMHADRILTPLGLTAGTGGFFTSTRTHANTACKSGQRTAVYQSTRKATATAPAVVRVAGDALAVTPGNRIPDATVVAGAQRAPFTSFVLTAGNDDVRIEGIRVKRFGLSSSDNFDKVALVDATGTQIGSARGLNSRDEASLGSNFIIPRGRSVTLSVVGNIATDEDDDFSAGAIAGLEIAEVRANTRVQGAFPVRGATHSFSNSITLQKAEITVSGGGNSIDFGEDAEVASVDIRLNASGDADEENAYLRSISLEQKGSADPDDLGRITVYIDGDRVSNADVKVNRDLYTVTFGGRGVEIEEGASVEMTLEINTNSGYNETIQFEIEEEDVYIVGAEYGFGLPVSDIAADDKTTSTSTIASGSIRDGGRVRQFEDEVRYGDDIILGATSIEFEGEDVVISDLTFSAELSSFPFTSTTVNAWTEADEDTAVLRNIRLRVDGEDVAYADDEVEFDKPSSSADITETVEFSETFTVDVNGDEEVKIEIVADLDEEWGYFDNAEIEFSLTSIDEAEGVDSEKDYTTSNEFFASSQLSSINFKSVEIIGNAISFEIDSTNVDEESYVAGSDNVVFATLEIDATDAVDDVEMEDLHITFIIPDGKAGTLGHLDCRITDEGGDEVADMRGSLSNTAIETSVANGHESRSDQARFSFDDFVVEEGSAVEVDIVCDIDEDASEDNEYKVAAATTGDDADKIEYRINRDDHEENLKTSDASEVISVSGSGSLQISVDSPSSDTVIAVAAGNRGIDNVETLEITLEAEKEDIRIQKVYLSGLDFVIPTRADTSSVSISEETLNDFIGAMQLDFGANTVTARPRDYDATLVDMGNVDDVTEFVAGTGDETAARVIVFDNIGEVVEVDEEIEVTLSIDYDRLSDRVDKTLAGNWLKATDIDVVWEGETSETVGVSTKSALGDNFTKNVIYPTVPTVSANQRDQKLKNGSDRKLYEFTITADDAGDIYVKQLGFSLAISGTATVAESKLKKGNQTLGSKTGNLSAGDFKIELDNVERIRAGQSQTFAVYANITSANENSAVTVALANDSTARTSPGVAWNANVGNFVWSPNTLDKDDDIGADNKDWFSGWSIFDGDDAESWTSEK